MTQNTVITQYIGTPIQGMKIEWTHEAKTQAVTNTLDATSELAFDITWNWHSLFLTTAWTGRTPTDPLETVDGYIAADGTTTMIPSFVLFLNPNVSHPRDGTTAADITYDGLYFPIEFTMVAGDLTTGDPLDGPD